LGLRERLQGKKRPTLAYPVRIDDTSAAMQAVADAQGELLVSLGTEREKAAREALAAAREALKGCFEEIVLTAMAPGDFEALVDAHPPREGTDDEAWNVDALPRAAFLLCAPDVFDAAGWEGWLAEKCSEAEQVDLFNAAVAVNVRTVSATLPKDWMETLS
jgi:hypothetical protein